MNIQYIRSGTRIFVLLQQIQFICKFFKKQSLMKNSAKNKKVQQKIDQFDVFIHLVTYLFNLEIISTLYTITYFLCYTYLIYYTIINMLNPVKYYINLSHNLLKWILLLLLGTAEHALNNIFIYSFFSKIIIMILMIVVVYPSKEAQKVHLKFIIKKKDQQYQYDKSKIQQHKFPLGEKILVSIALRLMIWADFFMKLISPEQRDPIIASISNLAQTISQQKYFWSIYENEDTKILSQEKISAGRITDRKEKKLAETINQQKEKNFKQQMKHIQNAIKLGDTQIMKKSYLNKKQNDLLTSEMNLRFKPSKVLGNVLQVECDQVIPITKNKFSHFREVVLRFYPQEVELELIIKQTLKTDKYKITDLKTIPQLNIVEFIFAQKSKFFQFKSNERREKFIAPIIQKIET